MLVLTRKQGEKIRIAQNVVITIVRIDANRVRVGIEAPLDVPVNREELVSEWPAATSRQPLDLNKPIVLTVEKSNYKDEN